MKNTVLAAVVVACFTVAAPAANAKGCLKGAAVGAVAGHFARHHGVLGAAAGCAVGRHQAKVKAERAASQVPATKHASR